MALAAGLPACGRPAPELTGAGGSFPAPVYARWAAEYARRTGVRVNYQPIGSGGGLRQVAERTVDFGATDVPGPAPGDAFGPGAGRVAYVPLLAGAVAVTYHVPGLARPLRLAPDVLADLFLGRVTRWDDPRLAALNPGARLPALDVIVVHRAEGSGTTYVLTDYLRAVSPAWRAGPGRGTAVRWPAGLGVRGNDGVAGLVAQTPGAVGYVEAAFAARAGLPAAALRNAAGHFVAPSPEATAAATAAVTGAEGGRPNGDLRVSLVDAPGAGSYPVASLTWLLLDRAPRAPERARAVATFARWALRDGGADARALGYAPLPAPLAARADAALAALGGAPPDDVPNSAAHALPGARGTALAAAHYPEAVRHPGTARHPAPTRHPAPERSGREGSRSHPCSPYNGDSEIPPLRCAQGRDDRGGRERSTLATRVSLSLGDGSPVPRPAEGRP